MIPRAAIISAFWNKYISSVLVKGFKAGGIHQGRYSEADCRITPVCLGQATV